MSDPSPRDRPSELASGTTRRRLLAALGTPLAAGLSGCSEQAHSVLGRDPPRQVTLSIGTLPADQDPRATAIAQRLASDLDRVGVDVSVAPMPREELLRDVLVNFDFDLYVGQYPGAVDPDFLRPLLHSDYASAAGWHNPFGLADPSVDRLLDRQRETDGPSRDRAVVELQDAIARLQPFTVVAFPDAIRGLRTARFTDVGSVDLDSPLGYLSLPVATAGSEDASGRTSELRLTRTDGRAVENLNPVSIEYRHGGTITGLLYDPLGRRSDGRIRPWLAADWRWIESEGGDDGDGPTAVARLRPDLSWHDGEPITAEDVAFTYRFLEDTSLGRVETGVPAPRFYGRASTVDRVTATDERTVRVEFASCSLPVAARALTVPVLPRHVWWPLTGPATVAGIDTGATATEAIVWPNPEPVGSGALRFSNRVDGSQLALRRFEDHFLYGSDAPDWFDDSVAYDRLVLQVAPADTTAVSLVAAGEADATSSSVSPSTVPRIGEDDALSLHVSPTRSFYHVGFNTRRPPLTNYRFRRAVAALVDQAALVETAFDGYASAAVSPLAGTDHCPPHLEWRGRDPVLPYPGTEGGLDVDRARAAFVDAGYQYDDRGRLLVTG